MFRHKHFEELAAVAERGELSPAQEEQLHKHLAGCDACSKVYAEYQELHAPLRASSDSAMDLLIESSREKVKAAVLRTTAGQPVPSAAHAPSNPPSSATATPWSTLRPICAGLTAVMVIAFVFWLGTRYGQPGNPTLLVQPASPPVITEAPPQKQADDGRFTQLLANVEDRYRQLLTGFEKEKQNGATLEVALTGAERELEKSESARMSLQKQLDSQSEDLRNTRAVLAAKAEELKQLETAKAGDAKTVAALQYQVRDLTEKLNEEAQSLDRERQLLANGRDIRDIIGARNLHIIDVYDTDVAGNTKKSFARAFYTEGKSLVFYAYDLPVRGVEDGKFAYTAWGEKNGNRKRVQKLGILLNDDKGQKRWALNLSDPKVLAEIDSVFVTLERVDIEGSEPKGKRMLTAYLDSQVNHP